VHRKQRRSAVLATLSVFTLIAVASCGGDDDDDATDATEVVSGTDAPSDTEASADTEAPDATSAPDETEAPGDTEAPDDTAGEGSGEGPDVAGRQLPPGESHVEDEGEPVQGGDLVFGLEADSANPWVPYRTSTATAGYIMMTSVSDPLFTATADGDIAPVLVESFEANDEYTEWTFNIREGIKFHDGTDLDGAAVEFNIESCQYSSLTGAAFLWIKDVSSSGQTVTITTNEPYVVAPRQFTERQCAYMMSPTWMKTLEDVPQRTETLPIYDAELAATPATGDPAKPVGLGA
jgi:peptide/nickel transport system substrate-binding protein